MRADWEVRGVEEAEVGAGSTRGRDVSSPNEGDKTHATRARWRVDTEGDEPSTSDSLAFDDAVVEVVCCEAWVLGWGETP